MALLKIKRGLSVWFKFTKPTKENMPTLVFIHGWVQNHTAWNKVVNELKQFGYGILLIDLPGHGFSTTPSQTSLFNISQLAKTCGRVIEHCKISKCVLVGHSLGGMISQHLGVSNEIKAVILADTTYTSPLADVNMEKGLHMPIITALIMALARKAPDKKRARLFDYTKKNAKDDIILWLRGASTTNARALLSCLQYILNFNSKKMLMKIKCPVLLIVGSEDVRTPPSRMKLMKKYIQTCKLVTIKNAGHSSQLTNPKQFAHEVHAFVHFNLKSN